MDLIAEPFLLNFDSFLFIFYVWCEFQQFFYYKKLFQDDGDHVVFWSPWCHRLRPFLAP
jgi:hypothetical protein